MVQKTIELFPKIYLTALQGKLCASMIVGIEANEWTRMHLETYTQNFRQIGHYTLHIQDAIKMNNSYENSYEPRDTI